MPEIFRGWGLEAAIPRAKKMIRMAFLLLHRGLDQLLSIQAYPLGPEMVISFAHDNYCMRIVNAEADCYC